MCHGGTFYYCHIEPFNCSYISIDSLYLQTRCSYQAELPCTESPCWVCSGCPGHAWAFPASSCPPSCPSDWLEAAERWQDCRAVVQSLETRSAGTRYLHTSQETTGQTINTKIQTNIYKEKINHQLTAHQQPVLKRGSVRPWWCRQGLLDLTSDPWHCSNRSPFKFGHLQHCVEHALWTQRKRRRMITCPERREYWTTRKRLTITIIIIIDYKPDLIGESSIQQTHFYKDTLIIIIIIIIINQHDVTEQIRRLNTASRKHPSLHSALIQGWSDYFRSFCEQPRFQQDWTASGTSGQWEP